MRTTLTISDDLADQIKERAGRLKCPVKTVINEALRLGLERLDQPRAKVFKTVPAHMGIRPGLNYDDIGTLLAETDADEAILRSIATGRNPARFRSMKTNPQLSPILL